MGSFSEIVSNASGYVKTGLINEWKRWIILIVLSIIQAFTLSIIPLMSGYLVRVYGTEGDTAPEVEHIGRLFIDGWKLNIITILYLIPAIVIAVIFGLLGFLPIISGFLSGGKVAEIGGLLLGSVGLLIAFLVLVLITLIMNMGYVNFSRSGKLIEAFNFGSITSRIQDGVGWGKYIVMWIIVWIMMIILFIILLLLAIVPILAVIIGVIISPLWEVFIAKIYCNIYDNRP